MQDVKRYSMSILLSREIANIRGQSKISIYYRRHVYRQTTLSISISVGTLLDYNYGLVGWSNSGALLLFAFIHCLVLIVNIFDWLCIAAVSQKADNLQRSRDSQTRSPYNLVACLACMRSLVFNIFLAIFKLLSFQQHFLHSVLRRSIEQWFSNWSTRTTW